ncbi:neutral zinc metallopeptidase [Nonomuraea typhae]|uniref:neutral zinc metallopeptidase n=1 Tax=Nonomuraea typhae TaxID=2603600 RepID=UPI0012FC59FC|nr:neutral zinc metallopeptidase [Nonomuraea typhae]
MRAFAAAAISAAALISLAPSPAMADQPAYPIKSRRLTHNALYQTGQFQQGACKTPALTDRGHGTVRGYLTTSFGCLNTAWSKHMRAARLPLGKPSFRYYTKGSEPFCQVKVEDVLPGAYCNPTGQIGVYLPGVVREYAPEVGFMLVMAHEYGHHVQRESGIFAAAVSEKYVSKAHELEAQRRYELQADCLAGVYVSSVWEAQRRSLPEWGTIIAVAWAIGDEKGAKTNDHGTRDNRARWFNKGFAAESPSACNTWTAPSGKVA